METGAMSMFRVLSACVMLSLPAVSPSQAQQSTGHQHSMTDHAKHMAASQADARQLVSFPEPLRSHTLTNMRDHLLALGEIQEALARSQFDQAVDIAEQRLGMSSLKLHGAHEVAQFMPKGMQDAGTAMHRSASQFATITKDASVTGDLKPALAALAKVNQTCVACHAAYRLH
ncbi:hypothetical protein [Variovorax sp. YR752]|uniref:hypothetical protein n=1 Tax=Variovorax sp. YR752 TaxID=1884383 RepID=UPI003137B7BA